MTDTLDHNQHRSAERRAGCPVGAKNARHTNIGLDADQHQGRALLRCAPVCPLVHCRGSSPDFLITPGDLPSLSGSGRSLRGGCAHARRQTTLWGCPLGHRFSVAIRPASFSRRFISSRLQFHRIGYQPGSYVSDPFEHLKRLSSVAVSYDRDPSERTLTVAQKPGPSGAKSV